MPQPDPFFSLMENALVPTTIGLPGAGPATVPQAASQPAPSPQGGGGWESALQAALPALAGFYAGRQGQLGTFTEAMAQTRAQQAQQEFREQQLELQRQEAEKRDLREAQQLANDDRNYQERHAQMLSTAAQRVQQESERRTEEEHAAKVAKVKAALVNKAYDPAFNETLRKTGPENLAISVPGLGNISLQEAFELTEGWAPGGLGDVPPAPPRTPLITTPGPNGPIRAEDKPGARVYERPRVGPAPPKPEAVKKPTVRVSADGAVTVTDAASGVTRTFIEDDIRDMLAAEGIPDSQYGALIRDPEALAYLVSQH